MLNAPRSKPSDKTLTPVPLPFKLFPPHTKYYQVIADSSTVHHLKAPLAPVSKLSPQQTLLPQENPCDIDSELIPYQEKEVEAVFKSPELDDFLLPPILGDQITDSQMQRHLPKQADIDRIMDQISRKYLTKLQLPCSERYANSILKQPTISKIYTCLWE